MCLRADYAAMARIALLAAARLFGVNALVGVACIYNAVRMRRRGNKAWWAPLAAFVGVLLLLGGVRLARSF